VITAAGQALRVPRQGSVGRARQWIPGDDMMYG